MYLCWFPEHYAITETVEQLGLPVEVWKGRDQGYRLVHGVRFLDRAELDALLGLLRPTDRDLCWREVA